ncbi:MAG: HD family phosphohydrolase [Deltaproteobacteria bacterium]|nr:MAG: HD family phosphohydrolase [Deltaproteobacteria bacterium]
MGTAGKLEEAGNRREKNQQDNEEKSLKKTFVSKIKAGQSVDDVFIARDKRLARKKDGEAYLTLSLVDRTGQMKAVAWDNVEAISKAFNSGDYVRVKGSITEYNETLQLVVRDVRPVDPAETDRRDFLPATERNVDQMLEQLIKIGQTIENKHLSRLLTAFFEDKEFVNFFKVAPAAKKMHHAYLGGLLEHTLSIALLIQAVAGHYKGIDKDLLLAGGILHDIGKIYEFSYETHIDYSDAGRLLNHIVIGIEMLDKKIATLRDFPEDLALALKHMIVSHHGTRDFGSPEPPKTLEAIMLYYLDELDAKVTGVRSFMESEDPDATWTSYHRVLERFFYKGTGAVNSRE